MGRVIVLPEQAALDRLFALARKGDLAEALSELGAFATGQRGYLLHHGQALRPRGASLPLIGMPAGHAPELVADPVLAAQGLEWCRVKDGAPLSHRGRVGALVLRAGLLARILDQAYRHLEHRESSGQKILQLQLVKADFVECYGLADQTLREAAQLLDETMQIDFAARHLALSDATTRAAKLMGGHGFLLGGANTLEFVSLCLAAVFDGAQPVARQRAKAEQGVVECVA